MFRFIFHLITFLLGANFVSSSSLRDGFLEINEKEAFDNLMGVHMLSTSQSKYNSVQFIAFNINTFPENDKYLGDKDPLIDFGNRLAIVKFFIEKAYTNPSTSKSSQTLKVSYSYESWWLLFNRFLLHFYRLLLYQNSFLEVQQVVPLIIMF